VCVVACGLCLCLCFVFFFQAEDGIRDPLVTGVQTCALPIYERARRQDRLQWATATWEPLPFDAESARMYGRMFAAARASGKSSRARLADLLIASTAAANGLPLYTRNPSDLDALKRILKVVSI